VAQPNCYSILIRDNEEGHIHYSSVDQFFSLASDFEATIPVDEHTRLDDQVQRLFELLQQKYYPHSSMGPWIELTRLPQGSTVPRILSTKDELRDYALAVYRESCCIGGPTLGEPGYGENGE